MAKLEANQIPWQKLAEAVGVSWQTINFIETGRYWGFLLLRNAPIELDLIFLSKAVDVESQCITFASLPHLCVFGVECKEIASVKFLVCVKAYGRKNVYLHR